MAKKPKKPNQAQQAWIDARRRHHLSRAHVQMARELRMNPAKLGKHANCRQEPWKAPLPVFIESCYFKAFGKNRPDAVRSVEEGIRLAQEKKEARRAAKLQRRAAEAAGLDQAPQPPAAADGRQTPDTEST